MTAAGDRAPDFTLADRGGEERRLSGALATGPAVLAFFKADCAGTLAFPYLERLARAHPSESTIWGICQHQARGRLVRQEHGRHLPASDRREGLPVSRAYDPPATPTIFLIAPDGSVRTRYHGFSKPELHTLAARVAATLGEPPVEIAPADDGKPSFRPG